MFIPQSVFTFPDRAVRFFFLVMFTDTLAFANPLLSFYSTLAGYSIGFRRPENAHSVLGGNPSVPPNL